MLQFYLVEEEGLAQLLHLVGDGELSLESQVQLLQGATHLRRQDVHSLAFLKVNISETCKQDARGKVTAALFSI